MALLTEDDLRIKLHKECEAAGSQKAWAERNGLSQQYVTDALLGKRGIGNGIAHRLGYEKVVRYSKHYE